MKYSRLALSALIMFSFVGITGCYKVTVPVARLMSPKLDDHIEPLEKEVESLREQYKNSVETYKSNIDEHKTGADESLKSGDLAKSFMHVDALYKLTHPCGEEDCGTYPCKGKECSATYRRVNKMTPINKYEAYMHRENIENEREFILEAVDRLYTLSKKVEEKRNFDEADQLFAKYVPTTPGPPENKKKFDARHKEIKEAWVTTLVADAETIQGDYPGTATLLYAKASQLAAQKGNAEQSSELAALASNLRAETVSQHRYKIALGSISGTSANRLAKQLRAASFPAEAAVIARGSAYATISMSSGAPGYSRSTGNTTGSFQYQSGTRQVTNPAWANAKSACQEAQEDYQEESSECAAQPTNSAGQSTRQCDGVPSYRSKAEDRCAEVDKYPQTVTEPVYDSQSYPIDLYHLDTSLTIDAKLSHEDGRGALSVGRVSARVTDEAHGAHSKNDGSVSADPARPPSESSGLSAAEGVAYSKVADLVMASFNGYRARFLSANTSGGDAEVNDLVIYMFLMPDNVSNEVKQRLNSASGISDAASVVLQTR